MEEQNAQEQNVQVAQETEASPPAEELESPEQIRQRIAKEQEISRKNYKLTYPSGFADMYPHLKDNPYLEQMRNVTNALVQHGYIEPAVAPRILDMTIEDYHEIFKNSSKTESDKRNQQLSVDKQVLARALGGNSTEESVKHAVHQKLSKMEDKHMATWMMKSMDDPRVVALVNYLGAAKTSGSFEDIDLYSHEITQETVVDQINKIQDNVRRGRMSLKEAVPQLTELDSALTRLKKASSNVQQKKVSKW